ncbi:MAG: hypothetical protein A2284_14635 [Deltaproteobacteria bacterium RIFOXYA12_FULL_61_11]|nr:MAG: hypothetical protein A2284_14635 [Deltaproteobacteria bacterium RIFOXYA12_FULL_61_11]
MKPGPTTRLFVLGVLALSVLASAPFLGSEFLSPALLWTTGPAGPEREILLVLRFPRVLLAFLAGGSLGVGGLVFQSVFRNPLASPYTLGVASGAAFGAALTVILGLGATAFGPAWQTVGAFAGGLGVMALVQALGRVAGRGSATLLLAGVAVSFSCSGAMLFLQYLADFTQTFRLVRWLMGGVATVGYGGLAVAAPLVLCCLAGVYRLDREQDLLLLGEELAAARGVAVEKVVMLLLFLVTVAIGAVVALCGPIGFVGLMIPHLCRPLVGPEHRYLVPATMLTGGGFLVLADLLGRTLIAPAELPVGVLTALLGGPFFLVVLWRSRGSSDR